LRILIVVQPSRLPLLFYHIIPEYLQARRLHHNQTDPSRSLFGHSSLETSGTLSWSNSDALKADDRENPVELFRDVLPLPDSESPDLRRDKTTLRPDCPSSSALFPPPSFSLCDCPKCHNWVLKKIGVWIQ
jgi:hypothetical protein